MMGLVSFPHKIGAVPPPCSYREKRPTSPLVQPKRPQPKSPNTKDENIPPTNIPPSSQPSAKTRWNCCVRERRRKRCARAREVVSQTIQSPKPPIVDIIPFSPKKDVEPKSPSHKLQKSCDGFTSIHIRAPLSINLDEEIGENVFHDSNTTPNAYDSDMNMLMLTNIYLQNF